MIPVVLTGATVFTGYAVTLGVVAVNARLAASALRRWAWPSAD